MHIYKKLSVIFIFVIFNSINSFSQSYCYPPCSAGEDCRGGICIDTTTVVEKININQKNQENLKNINENPNIRPVVQLILGPLFAVAGTMFLSASFSGPLPTLADNYRTEGIVFFGVSAVFDIWAIKQIIKRHNWEKGNNVQTNKK